MLNGEEASAQPTQKEQPQVRPMNQQDLREYQEHLQIFCQFLDTIPEPVARAYTEIARKRIASGPTEEDTRRQTVKQLMVAKITVKFLQDLSELILKCKSRFAQFEKDKRGVL